MALTPEQQVTQSQYGGLAVPTVPVNPAYAPSASNVYSPANVQQTMTAPQAPPNYSDPFGLYNYYYNTPDVVAARKDVNDLNSQLAQFKTDTTNQQNYLENQTIAQPVITGEQANQLRLRGAQQSGIADALLAKQSYLDTATTNANNLYQIAQGERTKLQDLITQTGGKAGISYADSYENAVKKADTYIKKEAEDAKKAAYKSELKAQLLSLGKNTKGLSTKELEKKLKKYNKSAVAEAKKNADLDYQIKLKSLNSGGGGTVGQRTGAVISAAQGALQASKGEDGKVDPGVYQKYRAQYASETGDVSGFDSQFGSLLSPTEQANIGVKTNVGGKQVSSATALTLSDAQAAQTMMQKLSTAVNSNTGSLGPIAGRFFGANPYATKTQELQATINATKQIVGKYLEGGVLRAEDEVKYAKILPTLNDTPEVAKAKITQVRNLLNQKMSAQASSLSGAGYNYGGSGSGEMSIEEQIQEAKLAGYSDEIIQQMLDNQ